MELEVGLRVIADRAGLGGFLAYYNMSDFSNTFAVSMFFRRAR